MTEAEKLLAEAGWKPIETAPRGGEWFMARSEHGQTRAVHYADEYDRFPISHDGVVWSTAPVEWMPISVFPALLARIAVQEAQIKGLQEKCEKLGRDVNVARYGQPDFAWSIHKQAMADLLARAEAAETALATERAKVAKLVEALRGERLTARLNAEALAEIKATLDGNSDQPVQAIMDGLLAELAAITEAGQ